MKISVHHKYFLPVAAIPVLLVIFFIVSAVNLGNPGFSVDKTQYGLRVSRVHETLNPVEPGDRIVALNGIRYEQLLSRLFGQPAQLQNATISVQRDGRELTLPLQTIPHSLSSVFSLIWLHILIIVVLLSLGFVALLRAPPDKLTLLFFLMLCAFSSSIASTLASHLGLLGPPAMAVSFIGIACCNWLAFGAWAHFACSFPKERDIVRDRPWLVALFYALPPFVTILLALVLGDETVGFWGWLQRLRNMFLPLIIIGAFGKHLVDFLKLPSNLVRNQIKLPLVAYWLSFGPYLFLYLLPNLLFDHPFVYFRTVILAFMILPLAYLFALLRYRLFAVDRILSRIMAYIVLVITFTVLYSLFLLALKRWFWGRGVLSEQFFLVFLVLVIVGFNPALSRVQKTINRFVFGNIPPSSSVLHTLSQQISTALEIADLVPVVTRAFPEQFGLNRVALVIFNGQDGQIYPEEYREKLAWLGGKQRIAERLAGHDEYLLCRNIPGDEALGEELEKLGSSGWSMVFRLQGASRILGLLLIGEKENGRVFNEDDILFLATLANHTGVAIENSLRYTSLADSKKQQEDLFEQLLQQKKMATVGQMSTVLAHELKNPLAVIRSSAQHLNMSSSNPEVMEEMLTFIVEEVDHLNLTINSLLTHARHRDPIFHGVELQKAIPTLLEKWRFSADHRPAVQIEADIPEHFSPLQADLSQLGQVLLNLIRNSEEAMGDGGHIVVSVREEREEAVIRVSDDGPGIPAEQLDEVFQDFYSSKRRGLGLGLPVCRQLIQAHNGTITVKNRESGGVEVSIYVPFNQEPITKLSLAVLTGRR